MYDIGAVYMMKRAAELLPGIGIQVVDDFDEAGGRGMPPYVRLIGPDKREEHEGKINLAGPRIVATTEHVTLSVYPLVFRPEDVQTVVWKNRVEEGLHGETVPFGGQVWRESASTREMLAHNIISGLGKMMSLDEGLAKRIGVVLLPKSSHRKKG